MMNSLTLHNANANAIHTLSPFPSSLFPPNFKTNRLSLPLSSKRHFRSQIRASFSSSTTSSPIEIDMVKNSQGIYTPKHNKVVVLWDLDNKPPRGPPYQAAASLKTLAQHFGDVIDFSAYANRHAFIHLPQWVLHQRRERKNLDILERKGIITPSQSYVCGVCGRKCKTNLDLKKHFKNLHERERQKKLNRMRSLKGKKRQRFKERYINGNHKYNEAARDLVKPKVGYGLASELRRAGVYVKTVEDKPQAADWALKKQMQHSMSRGVDWLVLVSDDSDFSEMLRKAKEEGNLGTVVVGDMDKVLGKHADLWVPWIGVENGKVSEMDLVPKKDRRRGRGSEGFVEEDGVFSVSNYDGGAVVGVEDFDEIVAMRSEFNDLRNVALFDEDDEMEEDDFMLVFSEDEYTEDDDEEEDDGFY